MRILVTGATGLTGHAVLTQALAEGAAVTGLTRDARRLPARDGLTVVELDPGDAERLRRVLPGHDAVIHCIGISGKGDGGPTTVVSDATAALIPAMQDSGVSRLIALSNVGAGSSRDQGSWVWRRVLQPAAFRTFLRWLRPIIDDKDRVELLIRESGLDWTIVRLPNVSPRGPRRSLRLSTGRQAVGLSIGVQDLAAFLVATARGVAWRGAAVSVSN